MPSPFAFNFVYVVNAFNANALSPIGGPNVLTVTVTDDQDGSANDSTGIGSNVSWDFGAAASSTPQLIGLTPAGDPVFFDGSSAFILSNDGGLGPGNIQTNTSGSFLYCFAAGTQIATPMGESAIENLQIGDLIRTHDGCDVAVKWVGRQSVAARFNPAERLRPVRFAAGSLGNDLPHSDLTVTADHAMLIDDVLCTAGALVNGSTITRMPPAEMGERFTVYHIETEAHDIILANGAASETYIDHASRRVFDNFAEYEALYGDEVEIAELKYPRVTSARQIPGHLLKRLGMLRSAVA